MGSSRPNWWRRFARTSGGTLGFVASSSKGSPGASARMVNSTRLIPARTGRAITRRRTRYLDMRGCRRGPDPEQPGPRPVLLPLAVPVLERPEVGVPAAALRPQPVADGRDPRALDHRDHDHVLDHQVVHLYEERRPLDGIHLRFPRAVELVILLVPPSRDVPQLP